MINCDLEFYTARIECGPQNRLNEVDVYLSPERRSTIGLEATPEFGFDYVLENEIGEYRDFTLDDEDNQEILSKWLERRKQQREGFVISRISKVGDELYFVDADKPIRPVWPFIEGIQGRYGVLFLSTTYPTQEKPPIKRTGLVFHEGFDEEGNKVESNTTIILPRIGIIDLYEKDRILEQIAKGRRD